MGEYATYKGQQIKIGTCEDMYYLRADQVPLLNTPNRSHGDTDVKKYANAIRFRFPFPDEDSIEPGAFDDYDRAIYLGVGADVRAPQGVDHYSIQFRADAGYLISLPCPESPEGAGLKIHRNGFRGNVGIIRQKAFNGHMILIATCGGCGSLWRYETLADAQHVIDACRTGVGATTFYDLVADRIAAGYSDPLPWEVAGVRS